MSVCVGGEREIGIGCVCGSYRVSVSPSDPPHQIAPEMDTEEGISGRKKNLF